MFKPWGWKTPKDHKRLLVIFGDDMLRTLYLLLSECMLPLVMMGVNITTKRFRSLKKGHIKHTCAHQTNVQVLEFIRISLAA
jgi:hypothetical protein